MWGGLMAYELATLPLITYFFCPHSPDQGHCAGYSALAHFSPPPALPSIRAIELGAVLLLTPSPLPSLPLPPPPSPPSGPLSWVQCCFWRTSTRTWTT